MRALGSDDWMIAALAAPQYGVVARRQLVTAGLTRRRIGRRIASGRLHVVHRGVYAVGHRSMSEEARRLAAVLACGDGAVLSHRRAGALWLLCRDGDRPGVTARNGLRAPGVETHRARLDPVDVTVHRGIPVTTVARTLADLGHLLDDAPYDRAVREAMFTRRFDEALVRDALTRRPCRRLAEHLHDAVPTQSALEDLFLAICDRHGIRRPATQQG